jgi:hypothetical protein
VRPRGWLLVLCGGLLSLCVADWSFTGGQTGRVASHVGLYLVAFAAYVGGLWSARGLSAAGLRAALVVSVIWRLALVSAAPLISDDIYRYVWEGRIQLHGGNPYAWGDRPSAEQWAGLRDGIWEGVNHKNYTAIYPPFWQLAARLVVRIHDSVLAMKLFLVVCELLCLWVLSRWLRRRRLPRERLLVLAWSPLSLVEVAGSGHNEPLGILALLVALFALDAGRPLWSALAAALAFQAKLIPGLLALSWARRYSPRHMAAGLALAALLVWPYARAGAGLVRSLGKYGEYWLFNESLFAPLMWLVGSHTLAVRVAAILVLILALGLAWRRIEPVAATLCVLAAWLALTPNLLPWYALWLPPLLVIRDAPPLLLFTGTVGLAYLVYPGWQSGGAWQVSWGVRLLEYGPCLVVAARVYATALWPRRRRPRP